MTAQEGQIITPLVNDDFLSECRAIVAETEFTSRWALVEGYHKLGNVLLAQANPEGKDGEDGKQLEDANLTEIVSVVSREVKKSERLLWYAIKFFRMYPFLDTLPEGKNTSWNTVVRKYLTISPTPCEHPEDAKKEIQIIICDDCGKRIDNIAKG